MRRAGLFVLALGLACPFVGLGAAAENAAAQQIRPPVTNRLSEADKIAIIRYVDGEYAKVVQPLPSVKPGFRLQPGQKVNQKALASALMLSLPAANPGDKVQITSIQFKRKQILVNVNGGSHPHTNFMQRVHFSVGMPWPTAARVAPNQAPGVQQIGSTLIVDFGKPVPNITPEQLKSYLAPFLNFNGLRSAAKNWLDSLPPKFRKAIAGRKAVVGMDRTMVLAALGRPGHKVRNFPPDGGETEDWIYGEPPGTTIFVTFQGEQVIRVKQYP
jgi:hypothetical protein